MRVYLDNCCYNRPFDEQAQLRVRLETEAKMEVQSQMRLGILEYVWSEMLTGEVCDSPYVNLREKIVPWRLGAIKYVEITEEIIVRAEGFMRIGIKSSDAIHLSCAVEADCDWFFTVDKGILKKVSQIGNMRVANPIDYVKELS